MIPYGRQSIDDDDVAAVVDVLRGDWLTQGPHVDAFEEALADRVGAEYAVTFSSGTAALHAACAAAELRAGSVGATSALTFAASANSYRYVGAHVRFLDVDPQTLNFDPTAIPPDLDALTAVHYAGLPVDLARLSTRPPVVIEDAAHALGATTPDGPVGNCAHSDMCMFSFHPVKHITTGEGGAITTNSAALADRLRRFRNHGIVRRPEAGDWYYEIPSDGFNYRMTDIQAALGTSQLRKLDRFISRRRALADRYRALLDDTAVVLPPSPSDGFTHAYHLFPVRVPDRRRVFDGMRAKGIGVQVHFVPVYRHPRFGITAFDSFPETERAYGDLLSLPLFPTLTEADQDTVAEALIALVDEE